MDVRDDELRSALEEEKPELVFTWWPVFSMPHDAWLQFEEALRPLLRRG